MMCEICHETRAVTVGGRCTKCTRFARGKYANDKDRRVSLRCTEEELARWGEAATRAGWNLSTWMRTWLDRGAA